MVARRRGVVPVASGSDKEERVHAGQPGELLSRQIGAYQFANAL